MLPTALTCLALLLPAAAPAAGSTGVSVKHPVFPVEVSVRRVAALKAATSLVMGFSREEIDRWIVAKSSFQMVACPNCEWPGGRRDRKNYWRFTPADPERIRCAHCGMVHLDARYPMSAVDRIEDPTGKVQRYPYYPGKDGYKYYLAGKIDNARKQYMEKMVPELAALYTATGEARYARQAGRILDRLADAYRHYNVQICRREGSPLLLPTPILDPPAGLVPAPEVEGRPGGGKTHYPYWSNRRGDGWNGWYYAEMAAALACAYDLIAGGDALESLDSELGKDVRANICAFFRSTANYARSFPLYLGNMDPTLVRGFAVIGRVIGEPDLVHDAVRRVEMILQRQFFPDGNWKECAPSYHAQAIGGLLAAVEGPLRGYSDPPGYVPPWGRPRLENLDLCAGLPFLRDCEEALRAIGMPHGGHTSIHDTWAPRPAGAGRALAGAEPMPSHLHWGMGHAMLGAGDRANGLQAHLHFSGGYGHSHADTLNLILMGAGRELLSDIGYTHTILRPFCIGSLAHNLVVVDGRDQRSGGANPPADGYLVCAGRLAADVQYAEAGGEGAYPGVTTLYRRALAVVSTPGGRAYVLDVFRVAGGSRHDWILHGSADEDMEVETERPLEPLPGSLLPEGVTFQRWPSEYGRNMIGGVNNSYGLLGNLRRAPGATTWSSRLSCADGAGVHVALAGPAGADVFCGEMPSVRRAREDSARVYDFQMPALLVRREGPSLESCFAAVYQPCRRGEAPYRVSPLGVTSGDRLAVGLRVEGPGFTDYHLSGSGADSLMRGDCVGLGATGRYAFVRMAGKAPAAMGLFDGAWVELAQRRLTAAPVSGNVLAVRSAESGDRHHVLVVDAAVASRAGLPGERVVVRFGNGMTYGLGVARVDGDGRQAVIELSHRAGFRLAPDGSRAILTHHPHYEIAGRTTFHLPGTVYEGRD